MSTKIPFVCSQNRLRSATAEQHFASDPRIEAIGAGTNADAPTPVSGDLIEWADVILVMQPVHRQKVNKRFGELLRGKKLAVLGIPDRYGYMELALTRLLDARVAPFVGRTHQNG